MADNRMYLRHRPTGLMVMLGKRYDTAWDAHHENTSERLNEMFAQVAAAGLNGADDFELVMEDTRKAPKAGEV